MVKVASLFNRLLPHFLRTEFAALVGNHSAERAAKGFTCWTQFVSMPFYQLGRACIARGRWRPLSAGARSHPRPRAADRAFHIVADLINPEPHDVPA